tara:strand:+ start:10323 stop:10595 length:273 start_codon:yes stop_codon:yes gene_type:complete
MDKKELEEKVKKLSDECHRRCGLSYELYCDFLTVELDSFLAGQSDCLKEHGYEVAKRCGWERPESHKREPDECEHHFTYDTCPLGCGEGV